MLRSGSGLVATENQTVAPLTIQFDTVAMDAIDTAGSYLVMKRYTSHCVPEFPTLPCMAELNP